MESTPIPAHVKPWKYGKRRLTKQDNCSSMLISIKPVKTDCIPHVNHRDFNPKYK